MPPRPLLSPIKGAKYHLQRAPFPLKLCRLAATCLFVAAKLLEPQVRMLPSPVFSYGFLGIVLICACTLYMNKTVAPILW